MAGRGAERLSLETRLALGLLALVGVAALLLVALLSTHERDSFIADRQTRLAAAARSDAMRLLQEISELRKDVLFLTQVPPAREIGSPPRGKTAAAHQSYTRGRLQEILLAFANAHREYQQIRYIGVADRGREVVRVNQRDGRAVAITPADLQQKGDRDYVQAALRLKAGEVHLSEISLNQEHGVIEFPHAPMLRAATPVFGADGRLSGVMVINLDFAHLTRGLASGLDSIATVRLANAAGDYLLHPEPGRTFGFDLGQRHRWQDDLPALRLTAPPAATEPETMSATMSSTSPALQRLPAVGGITHALAYPVRFDPLQPERHLLLLYTFPETAVAAYLARERQPMLAGIAASSLLILLLLLVLLRRAFAPLHRLNDSARAIAGGRYDMPLPVGGAGELGELVQSFRAMQDSIALRDARNRLLIDTSIDGFWMVDGDGRIIDANDAYARLSGYSRDELLTMRTAQLKAEETPEQTRELFEVVMQKGSHRFEALHRRKDGTTWPAETTAAYSPIEGGRFFAFLRDISERKAVERERGEQMNRLRSVMDALRTNIAILDRNGLIVGVNAAWCDFAAANEAPDMLRAGVGLDYLAACRNAAAGDDEVAAKTLAGLEAVRDGRLDSFTLEYPCHGPTVQHWFRLLARPLVGGEEGMVISHSDITERKLAEAAMRRDREQQIVLRYILEIILEGAGVETSLTRILKTLLSVSWLSLLPRGGVFLMDEDGGGLHLVVAHNLPAEVVRRCARVAVGHCHCGKAAATGKVQFSAHVDGDTELAYPDMTDHAHYCVPITSGTRQLGVLTLYLPAEQPRDSYNEKFLAAVAGVIASYLLRTEAEQALLAQQRNLEVAVKERTAELQTSEARVRALLFTMLDGVVHIDANGIMLSVNHAITEMFGHDEEELVGHNVRMLMPEPHASAHDGYLRRYFDTRQPRVVGQRREMEGRRKDGSVFSIELAVNEMVDDLGSTFIGVIRDMTAQKAVENELQTAVQAAQAATQAKSRFLANMSHEIRTPLNAVLGLAQIGMRDGAGTPAGVNFGRIAEAGEHLLGVINDILDVSKIEAGKLTTERRPFALHSVIDGVVSIVASRAEAKGLNLAVMLAPTLPAWVEGDSLRLTQILTNLLANAIKFTAAGEVRLRVTRDGNDLYFRITDTGIGMTEEQLARLFHPFEQADSSTTRTFGGTGLGLAISLDLARLMGGDINVDSRPEAGSNFLLRLPLPATAAPAHPAGTPATKGMRLAGVSLLAAEDVDMNRLVLEDLLVHEGAHIVFAGNGQEALEQLERSGVTAFDVVLMDVQMPVMDGLEATRRIAAVAPALPVVGLTAHALAEEREKCLAAGMIDVVTKPIELNSLVEAIRRQVRIREPRAAVGEQAAAVSPAPSFPATDAGAIDWPALMARFHGRQEFVKKLAASVREQHAGASGKLRAAAQAQDRDALAFVAHALKGISGNLEARRLYDLARGVDAAIRAGEAIDAAKVDTLIEALEAVLAELHDPDRHLASAAQQDSL